MNSPVSPLVPAAAFDEFLVDAAPASAAQPMWSTADGSLPAMYLSHGAPPLFENLAWMRELFAWSTSLPKPTAILIVSSHWEAAPLSLSSTAAGTTPVYDFGGFAPRYYSMRYDTPEASDLANRVLSVLPDGQAVHEHRGRGLDHGAWVPLKVMYPNADVPVLQMSLPTQDPQRLLALGERLQALRDEGVLVIGSGSMTHGLPYITREMLTGNVIPGWSADFDAWAADALSRGDIDELMAYQSKAPGMPYAHPTVEHYIPLFITLGAATQPEAPPRTMIDRYMVGISMRSFQVA